MKLALGLFFAFALVAFLVASAAAHSRESEGTYDYDRPERGGRMHRGGDTVRVVREREVEVRRGGRGGRGRGRDWRMMPRKGWWDDQYKQFCPSPNYTPTCWKFRDYGIWCPGPRFASFLSHSSKSLGLLISRSSLMLPVLTSAVAARSTGSSAAIALVLSATPVSRDASLVVVSPRANVATGTGCGLARATMSSSASTSAAPLADVARGSATAASTE